MFVEGRLVLGGQTVDITRGREANDQPILQLLVNGVEKTEDVNTTKRRIEELVGMDYETFVATVFFRQQGADEFTSAQPSRRKESQFQSGKPPQSK